MNRRGFLQAISAATLMNSVMPSRDATREHDAGRYIMTVRGKVAVEDMGTVLTHEHALANFQPYAEWLEAPHAYDREVVIQRVLPHLERIRELGCRTFVDATAVGLGRDPILLRELSRRSRLHLLTVTGNYAAFDYKFLPDYVAPIPSKRLPIAGFANGMTASREPACGPASSSWGSMAAR